ncbi:MAG: hypothetical protein ABIE94_05975 [archaeon]
MVKKKSSPKKDKWEEKVETGYKKFKKVKEKAGKKVHDYKEFIVEHPFLAVGVAFFAGMMWERMFGKR